MLIIEDNPSDAELVKLALAEESLEFEAEIVRDSDAAVDRLCSNGKDTETSRSDFIILDLSLPKLDGTEILQLVREKDCYLGVPVIVLSSSPDHVITKRITAANVRADCYLTKPPSLEEFIALGKAFRKCYELNRHPAATLF